jgi:hypothetical protein
VNKSILKGFFYALERWGHKTAHNLTSVDYLKMAYLSTNDSFEVNVQKIFDSENGAFFYSNDINFSEEFRDYISNNIIRDQNIFSDLYMGSIRIIVYRIDNQRFKLVYEVSSRLILKIV